MSLFPSTVLVYNLSNEPAFVYELALICDRGAEPEKWTSYKLKHAVLYFESLTERYELSCEEKNSNNNNGANSFDTYRWARVLKPYDTDRAALEKTSVPLEAPRLAEVLHATLDWNEFLWDNSGVIVAGKLYKLVRMFWFPRTKPTGLTKAAAPATKQPSTASSSSSSAITTASTTVTTAAPQPSLNSNSIASSTGGAVRASVRGRK
jgi:hypothetical protein